MTAPSNVRGSRLAAVVALKARDLGITESEACKRLQVHPSFFTRWKAGQRADPDPRMPEERQFYIRCAEFLDTSLAHVLGTILDLAPADQEELGDWIFSSSEQLQAQLAQLAQLELSPHLRDELNLLLINLKSREQLLPVLLATLRADIELVLKQTWHTTALEAAAALNQQRREGKKSDAFFGFKKED